MTKRTKVTVNSVIKILLACLIVVISMCINNVKTMAAEGYSGTPITPEKISPINYAQYGFTKDSYKDYVGYYGIRNAEELYGFAELVNSGNYNINGVLTSDIVVNPKVLDENGGLINNNNLYQWRSISSYVSGGGEYSGIFDGQGYSINGLVCIGDDYHATGLFGYNKGTIQSVVIRDSYFEDRTQVGSICSYNWNIIRDCYNYGTIVGGLYVGGICGCDVNEEPGVKNCGNEGFVYGEAFVGGISGLGGGFRCYNKGEVVGEIFVGGIVGVGSSSNCFNEGKISGSGDDVGGIVGSGSCSNCFNEGEVSGSGDDVGGIAGSGSCSNCFNAGEISGSGDDVGGICGKAEDISNCYYLAGCGSDDYATIKTEKQFASGEVCYLLNGSVCAGDLDWYQTLGEDGIPTLDKEHKTVYAYYKHNATQPEYGNEENNKVHSGADTNGSHDKFYVYTENADGTYSNVCSVCGHTVSAEEINPFADVDQSSWQYKSALFALKNQLMSGKSVDANDKIYFDPNSNMTRAEFVQVLYNKEGKPEVSYTDTFSDVPDDKWYTDAILWAAQNNIVAGKGEIFDVSGQITRQEMGTVLYKYANYKGYKTIGRASFDAYTDSANISSWAVENMKWAIHYGIMKGKGSKIAPLDNATRAECAAMLKNFMDAYE